MRAFLTNKKILFIALVANLLLEFPVANAKDNQANPAEEAFLQSLNGKNEEVAMPEMAVAIRRAARVGGSYAAQCGRHGRAN